MDDVQIPQMAQTYGPGWHFFGQLQNDSLQDAQVASPRPQLTARPASDSSAQMSFASVVTRELPTNVQSSPGMPVFVLNSGAVLSVSGYGYTDSRITYMLVGGGTGVISTEDIDWSTTTKLNNQRGVRLALHSGHLNQAAPGM
jgi:hypothetical protein